MMEKLANYYGHMVMAVLETQQIMALEELGVGHPYNPKFSEMERST